jgi:hypothetical protein
MLNTMLRLTTLVLLLATACFAQAVPIPPIDFSPKKYVCYKSGEALTVDGKMDEAAWAKAEWTDNFQDIEGVVKPIPRFATRAKMLWDENYLYVAAEIQEPDIWANIKNRDEVIFFDNDFEVFIDPDGDTHRYAEFEMNALNTVWDLLLVLPYRDTRNAAVDAWDYKGLKTGVSINGTINKPGDTDKNWIVEIAFPWSSFKQIAETPAPPENNDQWRINFSRVEWKTEVKDGKYVKVINPATGKPYPEDNWVWSPQGVVNMHYPEMWGFIQFANEVVGGNKVQFVENPDEAAKWLLRNIYYKESAYFEKNGKYTNNINELGIELKKVTGYTQAPVIECTTNLFEASVKSDDGSKLITIKNDGNTRITKIKK